MILKVNLKRKVRNILLKRNNRHRLSGRIIMFFLLLCFSSPILDAAEQNIPLAVVNGDTVFSHDMDDLMIRTHSNVDMSTQTDFDYTNLFNKFVNDLLILQQAYSLGMDENEHLQVYMDSKRKDVARRLYLSQNFKPDLNIPEQEIKDFFEENLKRYQFRTISVNTLEEAEKIYALLQEGHPFDSLVQVYSLDHRKMKNGLHLITFKMNMDQQMLNLGETLEVGEVSKPYLGQKYYTLSKLEKRLGADPEKYETYKKNIIDRLTEELRMRKWNEFVINLDAKYQVKVDTSVVEDIIADRAIVLQLEFRQGTNRPVMYIDDRSYITDKDLRNEMSKTIMNAGTTPFEQILNSSLNLEKEKLLAMHEALQNGYYDSTRIVDWYYNTLDSILIENYLKEMIVANIKFNHEEFQEYYDANKEKFRNNDKFLLKSMHLMEESDADAAYEALLDGAQYNYILEKYSAKEIEKGEQFTDIQGYPKDVIEILNELNTGDYTKPYNTGNGFVILHILEKKPGDYKTIEEMDLQIREYMFQKKFNELLNNHLSLLKEKSDIAYFDDNIESYFKNEL
ncbi:MAG: hypothetical protein DWP97_10420 [Calditrichaeota bacterium]|nr:MAG: hypothetical protein DWP97_10420 [Calditrichota bacterium]